MARNQNEFAFSPAEKARILASAKWQQAAAWNSGLTLTANDVECAHVQSAKARSKARTCARVALSQLSQPASPMRPPQALFIGVSRAKEAYDLQMASWVAEVEENEKQWASAAHAGTDDSN